MKTCGLDTVSSSPPVYAGDGHVCLTPPAIPLVAGGWRACCRSILAEQTHRPPSTLSPLCTQGVRPGSTELHFMVTKTTMLPSRNCQQHHHAQVFGPIFAELEEPRLLRDIDLDSSLSRKSGMPRPAFPSTVAFWEVHDLRQKVCYLRKPRQLVVVIIIFPIYPGRGCGRGGDISRLLIKIV